MAEKEQAAAMPNTGRLTETQRRALAVLARSPNGMNGADFIAHYMGYRPCRSGRLAVSSALRALLKPNSDVGEMVMRLPPRDQWDHATWCITDAGRAALSEAGHG